MKTIHCTAYQIQRAIAKRALSFAKVRYIVTLPWQAPDETLALEGWTAEGIVSVSLVCCGECWRVDGEPVYQTRMSISPSGIGMPIKQCAPFSIAGQVAIDTLAAKASGQFRMAAELADELRDDY